MGPWLNKPGMTTNNPEFVISSLFSYSRPVLMHSIDYESEMLPNIRPYYSPKTLLWSRFTLKWATLNNSKFHRVIRESSLQDHEEVRYTNYKIFPMSVQMNSICKWLFAKLYWKDINICVPTYLASSRLGRNELRWGEGLKMQWNAPKSRLDSRQLDITTIGDSTYLTAILTSPKSVMICLVWDSGE